MFALLRINVSGFRMLAENFTIDLTTKARVSEEDKETEVQEVDKSLYSLRTYAFVGGNSSGKTTVLSLIWKTLTYLQTGRWEYLPRDFSKDTITLKTLFYLDGYLYDYQVAFSQIPEDLYSASNLYSPLHEISLKKLKYVPLHGKKNLEFIKTEGEDCTSFLSASLPDTSAITKLTRNTILVDDFSNNNIANFSETILRNTFFTSLKSCQDDTATQVIRLLDNSIEYIHYDDMNHVHFKRFNEPEAQLTSSQLISILSSGTFRGVELYIRCINALKKGKIIFVDEIENSFHKNLVNNLLFLFNDDKINTCGAKLFFSTHYVEILDYLERRDGIFITHKKEGKITIQNLYSDYHVRRELLKSKQYDNNVFDTALNVSQLKAVKRALIHELQASDDGRK